VTGWQTEPIGRPSLGLRWLVAFLILAAAVVIIPVGGWIGVQVVYELLPGVDTHITPVVHVNGHVANVTGEGNMPDGAVIAYSVFLPNSDDSTTVDGTTTVRDGRFAFAADISRLPPGRAAVGLSFGVGWEVAQPLNVVLTYGLYGERLAGDQVWSDSGDRLLEVTVPIEVGSS
jgi:hypothetical protein